MLKIKKLVLYIPLVPIGIILVVLLIPFIAPIKVYNTIAGVYLEVHETYAIAVDYTKERIEIPSYSLLRPVTKTLTVGVRNKGQKIVEEIEIPDSITEIDVSSFSGYKKLKKIEGGKNIRIIGESAFVSDNALGEIPYFEELEEIGNDAFCGCNLSYLWLSDTVKKIGDEAFSYNDIKELDADLNNVELGSLVFGDNPFEKNMGEFAI